MDIEDYLDKDIFWESIIEQAVSADQGYRTREPILFAKKTDSHFLPDDCSRQIKDLAYHISEELSYKEDPGIRRLNDLSRIGFDKIQLLAALARNVLFDHNGLPDTTYHVSNIDGNTMYPESLSEIMLYPKDYGLNTPGIYSSPYADLIYSKKGLGKESEKDHLPVIFEIPTDNRTKANTVVHPYLPYYTVEFSTARRPVGYFSSMKDIRLEDSGIPYVTRGLEFPYDEALLVCGGKVLDSS